MLASFQRVLRGSWLAPSLAISLAISLATSLATSVTAHAAEPSVPAGYVCERVAAAPHIKFPMFACFDDQGRLYVAESSGLDLYAELKAQTRKCRISRLEDVDGDGHFEKATVFAERLVFPMGLCWRDGKLYVADPPDLVVYEDQNDDGRGDERRPILSGFGHTDNGSLHGLIFGPDGWLYMTMGEPDGYKLKRPDGSLLTGESGALLRCRPDGSDPQVISRGFENLVEVAFTPEGDAIATDNWFQKPDGGLRDALVHCVPGGRYPYAPDRGTPQPVTGEPLPPIKLYPAIAISGIERYRGWGLPAMRGRFFSAWHNARKVVGHALTPEGSTFKTEDLDLVWSDDPDFHPSDVLEDADGSLLVIDTGAWYVQHCPTGKIRSSEATGGIYRVRAKDMPRVVDPWGKRLAWKELTDGQLAELLADPRPFVADKAVRVLIARRAIEPLTDVATGLDTIQERLDEQPELSAAQRTALSREAVQRGLWAMSECAWRHGVHSKPDWVRVAWHTKDTAVQATLFRSLAQYPREQSAEALAALEPVLGKAPLFTGPAGIAYAELLARAGGKPAAIEDALRSDLPAGLPADPFLEHALVHALLHTASRAELSAALLAREPRLQRAALVLLDQPPHRTLTASMVLSRVGHADPALRRAATSILLTHPEWGKEVRAYFQSLLTRSDEWAPEEQGTAFLILAAFERDQDVQKVVGQALSDAGTPAARRTALLGSLAGTRLAKLPPTWISGLRQGLTEDNAQVQRAAVGAAAVLQIAELDEALDKLAHQTDSPAELRMEGVRATIARHRQLDDVLFKLVLGQLSTEQPPLQRLSAAQVCSQAELTGAQAANLLAALGDDPLVWPIAWRAFLGPQARAQRGLAAARMVEMAERGRWRPATADLERLLADAPADDRQKLLERLRTVGSAGAARLAELAPLLEGADDANQIARGRAIFFGKEVACGSCHRVAGEGGRVGPDLSKIGAIRAGRDLLESVVVPSSTFAQGYETYQVQTEDGRVATGVLGAQTGETLILVDPAGREQRFAKGDVAELARQSVSLMPEGLDRKLTREQLRDVLAFLRSLR